MGLLQTVKTQMKCHIMCISSGSTLFVKVKKDNKIQYFLENYNLTPLDMYS